MKLIGSVTNCTGLRNASISENHGSNIATCVFNVLTTTLTLGDYITLVLGYGTTIPGASNSTVFRGYVKQIERAVADGSYTITANDPLIRAQDFFIASVDPLNPLKKSDIAAETLISDLLALCGLTSFSCPVSPAFVFGTTAEFEINLVGVLDYTRTICDLLTWSIWINSEGVIQFKNRKPYVMDGTTGQIGDVAETSQKGLNITDIISMNFTTSAHSLRNRVVVYGKTGVYAEATEETTALPVGFYKTAVLAFPELVETQELAQLIANYNVDLLCRLTETLSVQVVGDSSFTARMLVGIPYEVLSVFGLEAEGDWYIYGCDHQFGEAGFVTNLELRRMRKQTV